ncbi:MAG: hypothetical protein JWM95_4103 [Gemmatimonadetes bacterium]|nr:hypothetical protein [Gemmatimonadota bacterium]
MQIKAPGAGDRWLNGESLEGIAFGPSAAVVVIAGRYEGQRGRVVLLASLGTNPVYIVKLGSGIGDVRVQQSQLQLMQ